MKEDLIEYHPNGGIKHKIRYYDNDSICVELFRDENGYIHRNNNLPAYQEWYESGRLGRALYAFHGKNHNVYNPAFIYFYENGKILDKYYYLKENLSIYTKLNWMNQIKTI